jgi:hypothetical protein
MWSSQQIASFNWMAVYDGTHFVIYFSSSSVPKYSYKQHFQSPVLFKLPASTYHAIFFLMIFWGPSHGSKIWGNKTSKPLPRLIRVNFPWTTNINRTAACFQAL